MAISLHLLKDGTGGFSSNADPSKNGIKQLPGLLSVYVGLFQADDLSLVCSAPVLSCQFSFAHNLPWEQLCVRRFPSKLLEND